MRSLLSYFVSKNPKTVKPLGIFKDTETSEYRVFDEQGDIEDLVTAVQGPQGIQGPAGPQGEPGPVGPTGLNWQGAWSASGTYVVDDAVGYNGASWFCISNVGPTATVPSSDTTKWALLAAQGARGATGATGAQGPTGATGPAGSSGTYTQSQIQSESANISTLNFDSNQYYTAVGVQTYTTKLVYRINLTTSVNLDFPLSNDGTNGDHPLKFWFEMVPPSGSSFDPSDFFTVHYKSNQATSNAWYYVNNNPTFSIAQANKPNGNIILVFQVAEGTLQPGVYTIVYHKVV